jgi:hypothetical protein
MAQARSFRNLRQKEASNEACAERSFIVSGVISFWMKAGALRIRNALLRLQCDSLRLLFRVLAMLFPTP